MNQPSNLRPPQPNPAFAELDLLIGKWNTKGTHLAFPSAVRGHSSFEWLEQAALLVWHFDWEQPGPPSAISVIGHDDPAANYFVLYSDERGVARIYEMSMEGRVWKMHRETPEFSQRMIGRFSDNGNTITVHGELSRGGSSWEPDLDVIYVKVR